MVCDTAPIRSLLGVATPTNNDINSCTNKNYDGTQYNIMGYTQSPRKFTVGQADRAKEIILEIRKSLTLSKALKEPTPTVGQKVSLVPSEAPKNINNKVSFQIGPTYVGLGDIKVSSDGYWNGGEFYKDYTQDCIYQSYTDIKEGQDYTLSINIGGTNKRQHFKVWIDYDNDGIFKNEEMVTSTWYTVSGNEPYKISIPYKQDAKQDTYLRMRVRVDYASLNPNDNLAYGQVEDYAVRYLALNSPILNPPAPPVPITPTPPLSPETDTNSNNLGRVGTNTDEPKATLYVRKVDIQTLPTGQAQRVVFPHLTDEERATFQNVVEGTMIYNTTRKCLEIFVDNTWKCMKVQE